MKRFYIIAILMTMCGMTAMAQDRPDITHQTTGEDRDIVPNFTEWPQPFFNTDGKIEVIGCYRYSYNVTITSDNSYVWSGVIGKGHSNVIDYNEFYDDVTYLITLTSSRGSTTRWRLENGIFVDPLLPGCGGITNLRVDDPLMERN